MMVLSFGEYQRLQWRRRLPSSGRTGGIAGYGVYVSAPNVRRKQLKRTQKSLMQPMGVTSEGAVSQRLKGITHWSLISAVNVAQSLDTSIEKLLDDSAMKMEIERQAVALRVQLDQINQMTGNKNATGDTPVASGELLRLGLNQRPSD